VLHQFAFCFPLYRFFVNAALYSLTSPGSLCPLLLLLLLLHGV
jgi:hypothetical protein